MSICSKITELSPLEIYFNWVQIYLYDTIMDKVQSIILWHPKMYTGIPKVAVTTCQKQFHDKFETFIGSRISKERCIESWFTLTAFSAKSHLKFYSSAETCWLLNNIIEFEYLTYEDEYCSNPQTPFLKDIDGHVLTQFIFQLPLEITLPLWTFTCISHV